MPEPPLPARRDAGPVILVVEDDADSQETIRAILEEEGYAVALASNGCEALDRLTLLPRPALMLVDLMMPQMDGQTLLAQVEASNEHSGIPVVVMTASGQTRVTRELRYPLLRKPFDLADLVRLVSEHAPRG